MKGFLVLALFTAATLLGGCATSDAETGRNKSPPIILTFEPQPKKASASVRIGDEVQFVLPDDRGPNFVWQIVTNDPRLLRPYGRIVFKPGTGGAPGTSTIAFIAQRPSRSYLRFAYVPAAAGKETEIADGYEVAMTVRP